MRCNHVDHVLRSVIIKSGQYYFSVHVSFCLSKYKPIIIMLLLLSQTEKKLKYQSTHNNTILYEINLSPKSLNRTRP